MDLLLICRDALASSFATNLLTAMEAKKAGVDVAIFFTEEAVEALADGAILNWPQGLTGMHKRIKMADSAVASGLPIKGGKGQGREFDPKQLVGQAVQFGVPMYACPLWTGLLKAKDSLPEGIKVLDNSTALKALREAKTVVGSL